MRVVARAAAKDAQAAVRAVAQVLAKPVVLEVARQLVQLTVEV